VLPTLKRPSGFNGLRLLCSDAEQQYLQTQEDQKETAHGFALVGCSKNSPRPLLGIVQ
jgi:hypothetical protein